MTSRWWCRHIDRIYHHAPTHCKRRLTEHQHRDCGWYQMVAQERRNAEAVYWCEKHGLLGTDMECDENGMGHRACRMVPVGARVES